MKVSELIEHLKTFPQDVEVSAYDTTNSLALLLKGGVVLEEEGLSAPFYADYRVLEEGQGSAYYDGVHVSIVGGNYTHHGDVK